MRRLVVLSLMPLLAACASAAPEGGLSAASSRETVVVQTADGPGQSIMISRENYTSRATIEASRRAVWTAVPGAYTDVGLPVPALDNSRYVAGVQHHRVTFRLGQERLSRFFDCGMGPTGLNADQRALRVSLHVAVLPERESATPVEVRAEAITQSTEGAATQALPCTSSGVLEQRFTTALQLRALQSSRD